MRAAAFFRGVGSESAVKTTTALNQLNAFFIVVVIWVDLLVLVIIVIWHRTTWVGFVYANSYGQIDSVDSGISGNNCYGKIQREGPPARQAPRIKDLGLSTCGQSFSQQSLTFSCEWTFILSIFGVNSSHASVTRCVLACSCFAWVVRSIRSKYQPRTTNRIAS